MASFDENDDAGHDETAEGAARQQHAGHREHADDEVDADIASRIGLTAAVDDDRVLDQGENQHRSSSPCHDPTSRASSTRVRTPTPVAPLGWYGLASSAQAVPAISTCTHGRSPVNSLMKSAAVIAPPGRPPVLLMSAMSLLSCSL